MSQETRDIIEGALLLVPFLILVCAAAYALAAFNRRRYDRALSPLAPVISGTVNSDGNSGLMAGTYRGRGVQLSMSPGTRSREFTGHPTEKRNILQIEMTSLPGQHDWRIIFGNVWGFDRNRWRIAADDRALEERLNRSDVVAVLDAMGNWPLVRYRSRDKTLVYSEDIRPHLAPSLERFQKQLELLLHLAKVNEQVNPV